MSARIQERLAALPPTPRVCLLLRERERLSVAEIAERLRLSREEVREWLYLAREEVVGAVSRESERVAVAGTSKG